MAADGVSPLLQALYEGRREDALLLRDSAGPLTLFEAAALGDIARVEQLVEADRAAPGARSPDGFTALHLAAFFGQPQVVRSLLAHGADPSPVAENPMRVTPLHSAAAARDAEAVRALLDAGADPDARQQRGITALHAAAMHGDREIVALLRGAGADPALADDDGTTAAGYARRGGFDDLATDLEGPA